MIEVRHLTKYFGTTPAVNDVSFTVRQGESIGLLGPNGSGKTTIMRILTGFFPPTSGEARVAGYMASDQSLGARRAVGYLPENSVLYPEMRVQHFLDFCGQLRRLPAARRRQRLQAVLHDCGLDDVAARRIGTLSKGYRQRVALAQALLHEPAVLILDEPTVGLDPRQVVEMRNLVLRLRGRCTVLLSTHILSEVGLTCDRVVIIHRGRIIAEDTAEGLTRRIEGNERTLLCVGGPWDSVKQVLRAVPGVGEVEAADSGAVSAAVHHFVVHSGGGEAVRAALAAAVVTHGWKLIEMRPLALSLEDLFVRLVDQASATPREG